MNSQPFLLEVAVEAKLKADHDKLVVSLARLAAHDSSFGSAMGRESGQTLLRGVCKGQLAAAVDILRRIDQIEFDVGPPQVAYRDEPFSPAVGMRA